MTRGGGLGVLENSFKEKVASGWSVLIVCSKDAERNGSAWTGRWNIFCVSPDGSDRSVLVMRKNIEPRVILTIHGVTSFLVDLGLEVVAVPTKAGATVSIGPDHQVRTGREAG